MIIKDVFRLIKTTKKRFFAIAAIVLIGVAFMFGLLANTNIMRVSVQKGVEDNNLQDIQLYSNYGFDNADIRAIKQLENVDEVFASRTRDVYGTCDGSEPFVIRVKELNSKVNKYELVEGRKPIKSNECLYVDNGVEKFKIGEEISIYLEDEELEDSFKNQKFTITGIAKTPEYMSKMLSTSLLNNLDLEAVILIPNNNFISKYYTTVSLTIKGSKDFNMFDDDYYEFIDIEKERIEEFAKTRQDVLKNKIISEAMEKIEDAKEELEEGRADGQKELDDAWAELEDARKEILDAQKEIEENEKKLWDAQNEIDNGMNEVRDNSYIVNDGIRAVEDASGKAFDDVKNDTENAYNTYYSLKGNKQTIEDNINLLNANKTNCEGLIAMNSGLLSPDEMNHANVQAKLMVTDPTSQAELFQTLYMLDQAFTFLESYDSNMTTLTTNLAMVDGGINQIMAAFGSEAGLNNTCNNLIALASGRDQLAEAEGELNKAQKEVEDGFKELYDGIKELEDGKKEYEDGLKEYYDGVAEFEKEINDAQEEIDDAIEEINDLGESKWTVIDNESLYSIVMYKNSCKQMNAIGIVIPIIFFLVAALVCSTTMKRLIDEQRGQIGIYVALGYSNSSIAWRYLLYVITASLFSSIIAIFIGVNLFPTIIYTTWRLLYNLPSIQLFLPIDKLLICVSSFVVLMSLVSYNEIRQSLKEKPANLMRPKPPKSSKKIILERIKFIWNKLSFTSKITARNIFRYKSRFLMTVLGVAGCTGLLVLGFGIKDSISNVVNMQYEDLYQHNYVINLEEDNKINDIEKRLNELENVETYSPYLSYYSKIKGINEKETTINAIIIDKEGFDEIYNLKDISNNNQLALNDEGVIITEKFSINENLKVGDEITISSQNDKESKVKIVAISKMYFQHYMFLSPELYEKLFNEKYEPNSIGLMNNGSNTELMKLEKENYGISSINDFSSFIANFDLMIKALDLIILVIIVTSGALAFVVLINLINVNISERIRELATLKVLGFRDNEVNSYIFKEIALLSIIGAIVGLPLGKVELKFVMSIINVDMIMFPTEIKFMSYLFGFSITMIFTAIVLFFTRKTLRKIEMIESLKSVE